MTDEELKAAAEKRFAIMRHFRFEHLPPRLQDISAPICRLAREHAAKAPGHDLAELVAGLRKLLEAKDCLVRAYIPPDPRQPAQLVDMPTALRGGGPWKVDAQPASVVVGEAPHAPPVWCSVTGCIDTEDPKGSGFCKPHQPATGG